MKLEMQLHISEAVNMLARILVRPRLRPAPKAMTIFYSYHSVVFSPRVRGQRFSQILWMPRLLRTAGRDNGLGGGSSANCN